MNTTGRLRGLWKRAAREIERDPGAGRLSRWRASTAGPAAATGRGGFWSELGEGLPFEKYRPRRIERFESRELRTRDGRAFKMLHNPERWTYYHLPEDCWAIWDLLDGSRTTAELYLASYERTGKLLAYRKFIALLQGLHEKSFLEPPPRRVFSWLATNAVRRTAWQRFRALYDRRISIRGLDPLFTRIHRALAPLRRSGVRAGAWLLVALGVAVFALATWRGDYGLLTFRGSYVAGLFLLLGLQLLITAFHELGHALSMKSIGRRVDEAGIHLSLPIPGAFVNTNDIHLEDDPSLRVAVSWAGPFADLLVAGACGVGVLLFPGTVLASILYKTAFLNYLGVFINLDPGRPTDGHYMLVDHLGIPNLMGRVSEYLRLRFVRQILRREPMSPQDRILATVGVLASLWRILAGAAILSVYAFLLLSIWRTMIGRWSEATLATRGAFVFLAGITAAPLAFAATVRGRRAFWTVRFALERIGFFRRDRFVYAWSLSLVAILAAWPLAFGPPPWYEVYADAVSASALVLAGLLAADLFGWEGRINRAALLGLGAWAAGSLGRRVMGSDSMEPWLLPLDLASSAALFLAGYLSVQAGRPRGVSRFLVTLLVGILLVLPAGGAAGLALELSGRGSGTAAALFAGWSGALALAGALLLAAGLSLLAGSPLAVPFAIAVVGVVLQSGSGGLASLGANGPAGSLLRVAGGGLFLAGLALTRRAFASLEPGEEEPRTIDFEDPKILLGAGRHVVERLLRALERFYGPAHFEIVESRLNQRLLEAGLPFTVLHGRVRSSVPGGAGLADVSSHCVPLLGGALAEASWLCGPRALDRLMTRIYDRLFWEERELLGHHVFGSPQWSGSWTARPKPSRLPHEILRANPLFASFTDGEIAHMVRIFRVYTAEPGEVLIRQGSEPTRFYLIARGRVEILDEEKGVQIAVLEEGDPFGEMALTEGTRCLATCASVGPTTLYVLERDDFRTLNLLRDARTGELLVRTKDILRLIASVPIFAEAGPQELTRLVQELRVEEWPAGSVVVREGEPGEDFYLVHEGRLSIHQTIAGDRRRVREIGKGEFFGEIALMQDCPRTASVEAETDVALLALSRRSFREIVLETLQLGEKILTISTRHLRAADRMRQQEAAARAAT